MTHADSVGKRPFRRAAARLVAAGAAALLLGAGAALAAPKTITVAADGSGDYRTVQEAVAAAPAGSAADRTVIHIKPGVYQGQVIVPKGKDNLTFAGDDARTTVITIAKTVHDLGPDGKEIGIDGGCGAIVDASGFQADKITFQNSAGDHGQALALRLNGDRAVLQDCRLLGWQDTLLCWTGRSYFHDCYIAGRVDFIYGGGTAVFDHCEIHSRNGGHVTAASTPQDQPYGFVFLDCRLTGDPTPWANPSGTAQKPASGPVQADLGRPWRPYASVTYIDCTMGDHIKPEGWNNWRNPANEKTARYAEYDSRTPDGRPVDVSKRAPWSHQLTADQAKAITVVSVLGGADGWNPASAAPVAAGDPAAAKVRIVLAGDSTVTDTAGWGAGFKDLLTPNVALTNLSRGGRSSRSFRDEGLWSKVLALKPDYVLIQFGHNDQPGHGPERETDPNTTYRANMTRYVGEARAAGIQPILVTSLSRRQFGPDGRIHSTLAPYVKVVREIAAQKKVPLIDLHARSIALYEKLGPEACKTELSPKKGDGYDGTHLTHNGSEIVARLVVDGLKQAVPALTPDLK